MLGKVKSISWNTPVIQVEKTPPPEANLYGANEPEKKTFTNLAVELGGWSVVSEARGDKWD